MITFFFSTHTDTENPIISGLPANIIQFTGNPSIVVNWIVPIASDNSGVQSLTSTHSPGTNFLVGSTPVTYSSIDSSGNMETKTFIVTVKGTILFLHLNASGASEWI